MKGLKVCYYLTFVNAGLSFGEGTTDERRLRITYPVLLFSF